MRKLIRFVPIGISGLVLLVATAWAAGAFYFDLPIASLRGPLALTYGVAILAGTMVTIWIR